MSEIRRAILWVILSFSLVLLWDKWQEFNGRAATFFPKKELLSSPQKTSIDSNSNASSSPDVGALQNVGSAGKVQEQFYDVETDVFKLRFSSKGGSLVRAELLRYSDPEAKNSNVVLLDDRQGYTYIVQTGLGGTETALPNHHSEMRLVSENRKLSGDSDLQLKFESNLESGVRYVKTWTFHKGRYDAQVKHEVFNDSEQSVSPHVYLRLLRDGNKPAGESAFYYLFTGPVVYTEAEKFKKIEFDDLNKTPVQSESSDGYVAMVQHHFTSAWVLPQGVARKNIIEKDKDSNLYSAAMTIPLGAVDAHTSKSIETTLFLGPQLEKELEKILPGLELVKDYGWVTILAKPLYWLLDKLHGFLGNWGWAIVVLVVLIKIAFYGLNAKAYASMAKMKKVNPRIVELRERMKDNPKQMQSEMMRIYKEEKVNPMGGCLPMVVQFPVFIALYTVLSSSVEMRGAPWEMWIKDLSAPDPLYILPLVMTGTTMIQTWLNPTPPDPMQAKMMWIMPLAFSVMFFFFPAGLVLYWTTNNILTILQQWLINKRLGVDN